LTIKIGNNYIVCPREGGKINVENFKGFLLCPDYNLICTGTVLCNNILDCFDKKSEEKSEAFNYDYEIQTTQNTTYTQNISSGWELASDGTCPYLCKQCDINKKCIKCIPHYIYKDEEKNVFLLYQIVKNLRVLIVMYVKNVIMDFF
jgi:hypothetical protein